MTTYIIRMKRGEVGRSVKWGMTTSRSTICMFPTPQNQITFSPPTRERKDAVTISINNCTGACFRRLSWLSTATVFLSSFYLRLTRLVNRTQDLSRQHKMHSSHRNNFCPNGLQEQVHMVTMTQNQKSLSNLIGICHRGHALISFCASASLFVHIQSASTPPLSIHASADIKNSSSTWSTKTFMESGRVKLPLSSRKYCSTELGRPQSL